MGVLLLVVFVAVAAHHADGRRLAELLRSAQPAWLGAAAALQVAMRQGRIRIGERTISSDENPKLEKHLGMLRMTNVRPGTAVAIKACRKGLRRIEHGERQVR